VTYKGEPLKFGTVIFMPAAGLGGEDPTGAGHPSSGSIKSDGTYELTTDNPGDGALVGEHKVMVVAIDNATRKSVIPDKYQAPTSTPLSRTVKEADNAIDIELTD